MLLASAICQTRWVDHIRGSRSLAYSQAVDNASRGILGSFEVLAVGTRNAITIACALLPLVFIGFEPFIQQVLRYTSETRSGLPDHANAVTLSAISGTEDF